MTVVIVEQSDDSRWVDPFAVDTKKMSNSSYAKKLEAGGEVTITHDDSFTWGIYDSAGMIEKFPIQVDNIIGVWVE